MAIRYLSEHDSPDDPGGLIREALGLGEEFPGPAEDVALAWILRLGQDRDPAEAATRLIADYELDREPGPGGACGRLVAILRETAEFPAQRMTRHLCQPRRRGGWRRKRP
ncbi:MAG: hypothetical protein GEU89_18810 [Kiloniellaceae bacterium]|nr:hypothetical protein [Kiloniellaceae bacterium]